MTRTVVCVLGMHRSGTSLLTRMINLLGFDLGPREHLIEPAADNPAGFWENRRLSDVNREILSRFGGSWDDVPDFPPGWESSSDLEDLRLHAKTVIDEDFKRTSEWAFKDPRTCLTLPFWQRVIPSMRYIVVVRNPLDVATSLGRREAERTDLDARFSLWLTYVLRGLRYSSGEPRLIVQYEDLMSRMPEQLDRLAGFVDRASEASRPEVRDAMARSVEEELWHHRSEPGEVIDAAVVPIHVKFVYAATQLAARAADERADVLVRLDASRSSDGDELDWLTSVVEGLRQSAEEERLSAQLDSLRGELAEARSAVRERDGKLAQMRKEADATTAALAEARSAVRERDGKLAQMRKEADAVEEELVRTRESLRSLRRSASWRLTKSLRAAKTFINKRRS